MRRTLVLVVALGAVTGCAGGRPKGPPPSTDIDDVAFRDDVRTLASDEFEGRRPGSGGEDKTVAFLSAQFRKLGLKPAIGESFVQPVPLIESTPLAPPSLSAAGPKGRQVLGYAKDMVIVSARAEPEVHLEASPLVFVGFGIVDEEAGWNDYAGTDVHGKTVLVLDGDPGTQGHDPALFKGNALSQFGRAAYKIEEAARQGAAGVLLIHDTRIEGYGWQAQLSSWSGAHLELASDADAAGPLIEGWLTAEAGRALLAAGGLDPAALVGAAARPGFKAVALGVSIDARLVRTVRRFNSANVAAVLPGASRKHEYVVFTAHWDGLGRSPEGALYPGAVDDASGVAGLLMLAQSFARTRPTLDRSLLFVAFTADEVQLLGARYYLAHPLVPLDQTAAVLCLEDLHIGGRTRDLVVLDAGNSEIEDYVRGAALLQGRVMRPEPHPEQGLYYRAEGIEFALRGVPALDAVSGIDDEGRGPGYGQAQLDEYYAHRYRQPADRYSEDWDVQGAVEDLSLYYSVAERLALMRRFPRWYPNSEFSASHRHARD